MIRPPFLSCMTKRSHADVICEEQCLVVKEKVYQSFHSRNLLAEFSTRTHCFVVVAEPSVTSKRWTCNGCSEQDSFSITL